MLLVSEVALQREDFDGARASARRALFGIEQREDQPVLIANARMMLARASWHAPAQRARARDLAEQARRTFEQESVDTDLEAAETWLAEHPEP